MRKAALAITVFAMTSLAAVGTAVAQYGPTPSTVPAGTGGGGTGTGTPAGGGGSGLAFTGSGLIEWLLRIGIVLLVLGGLVLLASRRRRLRTIGA